MGSRRKLDAVVERADLALYEAKHGGRDRVASCRTDAAARTAASIVVVPSGPLH
jgi:predicted signal transduction protein with EAL and GGDEF domain